MSDNHAEGADHTQVPGWQEGRLVLLIVLGMIVANVLVTLLTSRSQGMGLGELLAFGGGAVLGLLVEFGIFRRAGR
ncbi:hypothetical protein ABGB18_05340 [Nonomuraea sp. B12E4]|uniref:hypothetical protein n=1 Tax=Nonomuraea sp. B12E4 TaxID=3153564 RepID=UPI00325E7B30